MQLLPCAHHSFPPSLSKRQPHAPTPVAAPEAEIWGSFYFGGFLLLSATSCSGIWGLIQAIIFPDNDGEQQAMLQRTGHTLLLWSESLILSACRGKAACVCYLLPLHALADQKTFGSAPRVRVYLCGNKYSTGSTLGERQETRSFAACSEANWELGWGT